MLSHGSLSTVLQYGNSLPAGVNKFLRCSQPLLLKSEELHPQHVLFLGVCSRRNLVSTGFVTKVGGISSRLLPWRKHMAHRIHNQAMLFFRFLASVAHLLVFARVTQHYSSENGIASLHLDAFHHTATPHNFFV